MVGLLGKLSLKRVQRKCPGNMAVKGQEFMAFCYWISIDEWLENYVTDWISGGPVNHGDQP